ncbi:acyltransferase family protein [Vibrio sp. Vb339]|uniref:acyltransferase family protein n=1 Tax=Vibrio sp. Vb339 TaxID=1192013 RepID=UPI0015518996|nr:acyltransferase family protein [Vibrio sp. Vb339]
MNFRYDINGLRAIAVIAVVLFHFNPAWVPGGFAGVDVFFVISGFLMTSIIFRGLENDNFNLFKFYLARANRIIPALTVLCLVLLIFGWFYLTPVDYKALGKHVASSMGFFSNVVYWRESGYFDVASHDKWLLHTWSLSVEWQFYIIYPIVLVVLKRFLSLDNLKRLIVIGTVLGFGFSVVATMKWANSAYYLLPTRAWEMMMGGVAFLYPWSVSDSRKKVVEIIGLLLILSSYAFVSDDIPWPGHFALIPVLGSYLMIVANRQSSVITNNALFQYLGKWSYSIYLWHWPIVILGYSIDTQNWYLFGLPLSVILGFFSFRFVETAKFRIVSQWSDIFRAKSIYTVLFVGVVGLSGFIYKMLPETIRTLELDNVNINEKLYKKLPQSLVSIMEDECRLYERGGISHGTGCNKLDEKNGKVKAIIIGDSHASSMASGVLKSLIDSEKTGDVINARASGCIPLKGIRHREGAIFSGCGNYNDYLYDKLTNGQYEKTPVIIISRLNLYPFGFNENGEINEPFVYMDEFKSFSKEYLHEFKKTLIDGFCELSQGRNLYIVKPVPEFLFNVSNEYASQERRLGSIQPISMSYSEYEQRNLYMNGVLSDLESKCDVVILNPLPLLDDGNGYISQIDGVSIYDDSSHLNIKGSLLISSMFDNIWL